MDLFNNSKVTSSRDESPVLVHQLQSMLGKFMIAMRTENAKLAYNLESKLNKLSDNLDAKLVSVSESLDAKLNMVSDRLDEKINSLITNATSEMRRENNKMRQEFTIQMQTQVQLVAKEVEAVRNSTDTELTNCVQNFESECNKINGSIKDYKSQTDASMNSLRSVVNQNREEVENNTGNLTHEVKSVTPGLEKCNISAQMDKRNYQLEIQTLESQIENLRAEISGSLVMQTESGVCASLQTSTTIRVTDVGRPNRHDSPAVSELSNRNSRGVNGVSDSNISRCKNVSDSNTSGCKQVSDTNTSRCNNVSDSNTSRCIKGGNSSAVAISCIESVSAQSETYLDTSQYNQLSFPRFTDSSQQVAVYFLAS